MCSIQGHLRKLWVSSVKVIGRKVDKDVGKSVLSSLYPERQEQRQLLMLIGPKAWLCVIY